VSGRACMHNYARVQGSHTASCRWQNCLAPTWV
jgi:hypothetical protein